MFVKLRMSLSRRTAVVALLVLAAGAAGYRSWTRASAPLDIAVAEVRRGPMRASFSADGVVKGRSVDVAPRAPARVTMIFVDEGQAVTAGQMLVRFDDRELRAAVREAEAGTWAAGAATAQAEAALTLARQQASAREDQARAELAAAESQLRRVVSGPRAQEIAQAEQQVRAARAALTAAEQTMRRARSLFEQGAIARADLDEAEARYETAAAHHRAAVEALDLVKAGARPEEIAIARAQVDAARAALKAAFNLRGELRLRQAEVDAARARLAQARAVAERARALLADAVMTAPFAGVVTRVHVEQGELVAPGLPAVTLVDTRDLWIEADITDEDAAKIRVGLSVSVTVPAYPGRRFAARVVDVAPQAELKADVALRTRIVRAKLRLLVGAAPLRAGLEVDVEGEATVADSALQMPGDALVFREGRTAVFVVQNGVARLRDVQVGYSTYAATEILRGLREGELVTVTGKDGLTDGRRVRVMRTVEF